MRSLGLYIHIPFCRRKCAYCDFVSFPGLEDTFDRYIAALIKESRLYSDALKDCKVDTVFIGGGTPSLLSAEQMHILVEGVRRVFNWEPAEVTIEANPETLDNDKLGGYAQTGINRLSIGLQTHDDAILERIGRRHSWKTFAHAYDTAARYFSNINVDTIFGLPGQTTEGFIETMRRVAALLPKHISAYSLKLEPGTPLAVRFSGADEDDDREMYHSAAKYLENLGYSHYETSNFALDGFECRHNLKYWTGGEYLGLGVAAHSFLLEPARRFSNCSDVDTYCRLIENGDFPAEQTTLLTEKDAHFEYLMLRLRLKSGIDFNDYNRRFGGDFQNEFAAAIDSVLRAEIITLTPEGVSPTLKGYDLQNTLIREFMKNI